MQKAWDNRIGCAIAIDVLKQLKDEKHPNVVYGVGTVQRRSRSSWCENICELY
ncbi:hypothetical protein AAHB49_10535 [Bacillus cereus]